VVAFHPDDDRAHRMHSAMTMPVNEVAQMPVDRMMPWMPVWWMVGGLLVTVLVVALLIAGLYAVIRAGQRGSGSAASSQAMAILEERYARGEIDHEEFEERRRRLGG
jgi:putative membrane protein